jgi:Protein of unknown function (DUF3168)
VTFDLRPALRTFLLADAAIAAAVGGPRVFPVVLPQGERRASLVYTRISDVGDHHMGGPSGLARPRYQIDAYAALQDDADSLARLVKDRLDGFRGLMGSVQVQGAFLDSLRDEYEQEAELFRTSVDYII